MEEAWKKDDLQLGHCLIGQKQTCIQHRSMFNLHFVHTHMRGWSELHLSKFRKQQQRILLYKFIDTKDWLYAVCVVHPLLNWPM